MRSIEFGVLAFQKNVKSIAEFLESDFHWIVIWKRLLVNGDRKCKRSIAIVGKRLEYFFDRLLSFWPSQAFPRRRFPAEYFGRVKLNRTRAYGIIFGRKLVKFLREEMRSALKNRNPTED